MNDWCTIESDPGVFTSLIKDIGVKNISVEEVWSLDDDMFIENLKPIYGFIFLFKWTNKIEERDYLKLYDSDLFFARQVITNACATQAILSVLLNNKEIDLGEELKNLKSFGADMDCQMKGLAIGNSEKIRTVHNSFACPEPFYFTSDKKAKGKDDVFHFISYVPFKNKLYELDGLQPGPILLGSFEKENEWIDLAKTEINKRILKYSQDEIRFNLMAVIASKTSISETKIKENLIKKFLIYEHLISVNEHLDEFEKEDYELVKNKINLTEVNKSLIEGLDLSNRENTNKLVQSLSGEIKQQEYVLTEENHKQEKYHIENIRRKHNYIPFILELLKLTAKKGKLEELVDEAKKKKKEKNEKKKEKEKEEKEKEKTEKEKNEKDKAEKEKAPNK